MKSLALLLLFPAGLALAQTPPKASSRDELRACLSEQDTLQETGKSLERRRAEADAASKQLQAEVRTHMATSPLPNAPEEAFTAFRAKTKDLEARKEALDAGADQYDKDVVTFNQQLAARNKRCSTMTVTKADRDAVMKERAEAGKK